MTIHVSLPKELEDRVHEHVSGGMYGSASEVVREALRRFFLGQDQLSPDEIAWIRHIIKPRLDAVQNSTAGLIDGKSYFEDRLRRLSE